jgi:hypothetical protein
LYLGVCDWERDRWIWVAPEEDPLEWRMLVNSLPVNQDGDDFVAVATWHQRECSLEKIQVLVENPTSIEPWIYFAHRHNETAEEDQTSISRALAPNGADRELVLTSDPNTTYKTPHIGWILGSERLGFGRRAGDGHWEIWRSELDGSDPARLSWNADADRLPAGWAPDHSAFLFIESAGGTSNLIVRDITRGIAGLLAEEGTNPYCASWDLSGDMEYNALLSYDVTSEVTHELVAVASTLWADGPPPVAGEPVEVLTEQLAGDSFATPSSYRIPDPQGGWSYGLVCAYGFNNYTRAIQDHPGTSDNLDAEETLVLFSNDYEYSWPVVSPDGRWLAYLAEEVGSDEMPALYITDFVQTPASVTYKIADDAVGRPCWLAREEE